MWAQRYDNFRKIINFWIKFRIFLWYFENMSNFAAQTVILISQV